jgi:hypothetical protein
MDGRVMTLEHPGERDRGLDRGSDRRAIRAMGHLTCGMGQGHTPTLPNGPNRFVDLPTPGSSLMQRLSRVAREAHH